MSAPRFALVWLGDAAPDWPLGPVECCDPDPASVARTTAAVLSREVDVVVFSAARLGPPDPAMIRALVDGRGDAWHAGLRLGLGGLPGIIDFVHPTWMLNRDPDPTIEATSWRLSLEASVIRADALRIAGGPSPEYSSLAAAGLDLGHRLLRAGAVMRHIPSLAEERPGTPSIPFADEAIFAHRRFGLKWARWALGRAALSRYAGLGAVLAAWRRPQARVESPPLRTEIGTVSPAAPPGAGARATVTVLVPTIDRYPYLRVLLEQLRGQSRPADEIVVVDQTPEDRRDSTLAAEFEDLPLTWITSDRAGQCTSRNLGIERSEGRFILFLDDDDEIGPTLIEDHLASVEAYGADASSGVIDEDNDEPLSAAFERFQISHVFPTNNTMLRRSALVASGLFDLAYDRASRADGDLGMRLYLSGALMLLNPAIRVFHHHAPMGGLRTHKARKITYARSRNRILTVHLPSISSLYLVRRYFSPRQYRETLWLAMFGTASVRGNRARRALKAAWALVRAPLTLIQLRRRSRESEAWLASNPRIPTLGSDTAVD